MLNKLFSEFTDRGYLFQCTNNDQVKNLINTKKMRFYIGFDCTAKSLHVGSLVQIMCLRLLQKYGHTPVVLLGGGTTLIGDPSGKDQSRKILSYKEIINNITSIKKVFKKFLKSKGKNKVIFVNNKNWLSNLNYIDFLRKYGKYFTINKMLTFDSVKNRLDREQSLSFLEFNYMIFQAYDFLILNEKQKVELQIGGSDQWGNIVNGVDLVKKINNKEVYGLTTPLILNSSGLKMGKTSEGAVWLDKNLLSSYDYWQFWRNTDDKDVVRYLKLFTELDLKKIKDYESLSGSDINQAKILLADEATKLLHGKEAALKAKKTSINTFEKKSGGDELPTTRINKNILKKGLQLKEFIISIKFATSNSDFKRNLENRAYRINNKIINSDISLTEKDIEDDSIKISFGKKRHHLIKTN
tara:strand:- start:11960 stop:13195 length:1236 start_codon:yes stop_codon:yes gene_type:complete